MKSHAEILKVDARYRIMMVDDPLEGLRPITLADHYAMVAGLQLPAGVPEGVGRLYDRALHALLYGWFDYELMVVACGQALASLEYGLKARLGPPAAKKNGLAKRLAAAVEQGLIPPPMSGQWGDDHAMLAAIRNEIAHGSDHVYPPALAEGLFIRCRKLITQLHGVGSP